MSHDQLQRYHRQMLLPGIGEHGQRRLLRSHALIVGCGALGSTIADLLCRAGVGTLTLVDRDIVELTNLQRQTLFTQADAQNATPKAAAAKGRLSQVNPDITIHGYVNDFNAGNAKRLAGSTDIILDGLDNFETRYLLNDLAVAHGLPLIYGGAVGTTGMSMVILPHSNARTDEMDSTVTWSDDEATGCLRCVFPDPPPPGTSQTCDTAGVLGPVTTILAAHQAGEAIKLLSGNLHAIDRSLLSLDLWSNDSRRFDMRTARDPNCPCCGRGEFDYLNGEASSMTVSLCGRDAVQITPQSRRAGAADNGDRIDLAELAARLNSHGTFTHNTMLVRGGLHAPASGAERVEMTVFADGRAIIKGCTHPEVARAIYARYIGL